MLSNSLDSVNTPKYGPIVTKVFLKRDEIASIVGLSRSRLYEYRVWDSPAIKQYEYTIGSSHFYDNKVIDEIVEFAKENIFD